MHISIVSPIYKGEKMLEHLVGRCEVAVSQITEDYEIILVNDCSPDNSWAKIQEICARDKKVKGIDLSRNFGQHPAISAGLKYAKGDWVVVMDCDLQDRPEEIPNLYAKAQEGYDIVRARRIARKDKFLKILSSVIYHVVFNFLTGRQTDKGITQFGIYRSNVIQEICNIPDLSRSFNALTHYLGFRDNVIDVMHSERAEGKSGYSLEKLLKLAFDSCISNSNKPLRMTVGLGMTMSFISFLLALYNIIAKLFGFITLSGYTTTVFSIWFVGGLILFVLGVIGVYIGKIYDQVKGRPYAAVRETLNVDA